MEIFWFQNDEGNFRISITQAYQFLRSKGVYMSKTGDKWLLLRIQDNIIEQIEELEISQLLLTQIRNAEDLDDFEKDCVEEALRNKIARMIAKDQLTLLDSIELNLKRDTIDTSFLYFKDFFLEITSAEIVKREYAELDGTIWKSKIRGMSFRDEHKTIQELVDHSHFAKFIFNVSNKNEDRFKSLCSIIGYLIHDYKDPSSNKAVILMDEKISDLPEGGTGKSILIHALEKLREVITQDGKSFSFKSRFLYQDVNQSTSILAFDDVLKNFDIENLFSFLTDGANIEEKHKGKYRLAFQDTPKVLISTNYVLKGSGNSHERRRIEFEFSQHYNGENTPIDEFGHRFFDQWSESEWNLFYNFMVKCVQLYLEKGLIYADGINIKMKKIQEETCPEFFDFISEVRINRRINRKELMRRFEMEYPDISRVYRYTNRRFCKWVKQYAEFMGYIYEEAKMDNEIHFIYKTREELN